ncbi:glycosyltransferase family 2 protein [Methyloradius palustris]|uniref:Glycosyl transferase n=1 Tax=Methyloradius palustris TaxID=2778876 RepID=A0A8D5G8V2_9PROT|nr:glycosyltransferase family 2 protein [Methyloradius palustris]BCM25282.1 glycosyl transferase [Methyloradius palustris]
MTIAIPTYNRCELLTFCLERIKNEFFRLTEHEQGLVTIFISDNASTDNTSEVILKYKSIFLGRLESIKNANNMGMDFNFIQCYESAKSPYVWIFGDDDVLLPYGLNKVLNAISSQDVDLLYVNNYWFINDYEEKVFGNKKHGEIRYKTSFEFTKQTNVMLTYLSGLIVRSGIGREYRNELMGTKLVQLSWVLPQLIHGKIFIFLQDWIVAAKGGNTEGYSLIKVFGENLQTISRRILFDKPKEAQSIVNGTIVNFFPGFVLEIRMKSSKFIESNIGLSLSKIFDSNWRYYIFLFPLLKLPLFLAFRYNQFLNILRRVLGTRLV